MDSNGKIIISGWWFYDVLSILKHMKVNGVGMTSHI
jgi:hypothetical protein